MMRLDRNQIGSVRDALRRSHQELAAFAETIAPNDHSRRSYCTEWTVAQVYSHLGSGAEIEVARIRAALAGDPPPDPGPIWQRWNALSPAQAVGGFASADAKYLELIDELDPDTAHDIRVTMDSLQLPLPTAMVLRLTEHALHSWDIYVAFDPTVEVGSYAADLLVDLYPREIITMVATRQVAGRAGKAALRVDIDSMPRTLRITFADSVSLQTAVPGDEPTPTGHIRLPTSGTWARLFTGRLDDDHMPNGITSTGRPTLLDLRALLQAD
jgi:uncharacterized protein (TIGR03083 family)